MRDTRSMTSWLLVFILAAFGSGCTQEAGASTSATPVVVQTERVAETEVEENRRLSGDVQPWELLPLSFKVGGRISRILVEEGDRVRARQPVAYLDSRDYVLARDLARAQIDSISPHLHRAEALHAADALPKAKLDEVEGKMNVAKIQRDQAASQLAHAALHAPIDGVVVQRPASPGQMAGPSAPVVVIASLDPVKISLPVAQRDLPLFDEGESITLTSVGLDEPVTGKVHSIGYAADSETRTFPVVVRVANPDLRLRAGMIVETKLTVDRHRGFFLPLRAVRRDLEGHPAVLVVDRESGEPQARIRRVKTETVLGDRIQVVEGLHDGDEVVVRGLAADGDPVVVADAEG